MKTEKINAEDSNPINVFDFMEYRLRFACEFISKKSYWYAYVIKCKEDGLKKVRLNLSDEHKKEYNSIIDTDNFTIDQIPPFTPYCTCEIKRSRK